MRDILKKTIALMLCVGLMVIFTVGCSSNNTKETSNNTIGAEVNETTAEKVQSNMESVFLDSKYVSGDSIDAFIDDNKAEEITIINKSSKDDTNAEKIKVQRNGDKYACNGKTYEYFYKMTHSEGNKTVQDYILGNVILDETQYDKFIADSSQAEGGLVIVASNIIQ